MQDNVGEDTYMSLPDMERLLNRMDNPPIIRGRQALRNWCLVDKKLAYVKNGGVIMVCLRDIRVMLERQKRRV